MRMGKYPEITTLKQAACHSQNPFSKLYPNKTRKAGVQFGA